MLGTFYGIGVGPGPRGYLPLAAWEAIKCSDVIITPRAGHVEQSVARQCLDGLDIPEDKFKVVIYNMDSNCIEPYDNIAEEIAGELKAGKNVSYLTIGDSMTYSTYNLTLAALVKILPDVPHRTFPGITSYAAIAAAFDWPLGQGKERILILPCPENPDGLRSEIETHDIIILIKIGHRLDWVLSVLKDMGLANNCAFGCRIGLPGEVLSDNLNGITEGESLGYLSTMLIRKAPVAAV